MFAPDGDCVPRGGGNELVHSKRCYVSVVTYDVTTNLRKWTCQSSSDTTTSLGEVQLTEIMIQIPKAGRTWYSRGDKMLFGRAMRSNLQEWRSFRNYLMWYMTVPMPYDPLSFRRRKPGYFDTSRVMLSRRLAKAVSLGDRRALSKAITLVESSVRGHQRASEVLQKVLSQRYRPSLKCMCIGISGAPGVGKSTFIEHVGNTIVDGAGSVAVLAVDPSSGVSGGSLLGDKTRMTRLACHSRAFVRASPSRGELGGISRRTADVVELCKFAGYGIVIVETVGVGQLEASVANVVDILVLFLPPSIGDDIQSIKRGVTDIADMIVVNKADGPDHCLAQQTRADLKSVVDMRCAADLRPPVLLCSNAQQRAPDILAPSQVWSCIKHLHHDMDKSGILRRRFLEKRMKLVEIEALAELSQRLSNDSVCVSERKLIQECLAKGNMTTRVAALRLARALANV